MRNAKNQTEAAQDTWVIASVVMETRESARADRQSPVGRASQHLLPGPRLAIASAKPPWGIHGGWQEVASEPGNYEDHVTQRSSAQGGGLEV